MTEPLISPLAPGDPQRLGGHELIGVLGQGGMGRVYLGISPGNSQVAVKVMHPHIASDPAFRERFNREVAVAKRVSSPFTADVLDSGMDGDTPWLATEYIPGPTLEQVVAEYGPLPDSSVHALAAGLARAVEDIHSRSVVHRDLKPSNVILSVTGPRVIDFGIARAPDALGLTRSGYVLGTDGYMSPEQWKGEEVTGQSDVYSLGALLVFAATRNPPPPVVSHRGTPDLRDVPPGLRAIIARCLQQEPSQRCAVADIVADCGQPESGGLHDWLPRQVDGFVRAQTQQQSRDLTSLYDNREGDWQPAGASLGRQFIDGYLDLSGRLVTSAQRWPLVRPASLRRWSSLCLALSLISLVEVVSRTATVESTTPGRLPWLPAVQSIRATIEEFTFRLPDPLNSWSWAAGSTTGMDRRLAGITCALVVLASVARRTPRDHFYQVVIKTVASYAANLIMIMMVLRLLQTGFNPLIHIAEYLRLWALLALGIAALVILPTSGRARLPRAVQHQRGGVARLPSARAGSGGSPSTASRSAAAVRIWLASAPTYALRLRLGPSCGTPVRATPGRALGATLDIEAGDNYRFLPGFRDAVVSR